MLEKLANEDDEDDAGDYYVSSGGNYSFMYDSPFDYMQDKQHLVNKMVNFYLILETTSWKRIQINNQPIDHKTEEYTWNNVQPMIV